MAKKAFSKWSTFNTEGYYIKKRECALKHHSSWSCVERGTPNAGQHGTVAVCPYASHLTCLFVNHHTGVMNILLVSVVSWHRIGKIYSHASKEQFRPRRNLGINLRLPLCCSLKQFTKAANVFRQVRNLSKHLPKEVLVKLKHSGGFRSILFSFFKFSCELTSPDTHATVLVCSDSWYLFELRYLEILAISNAQILLKYLCKYDKVVPYIKPVATPLQVTLLLTALFGHFARISSLC